MHLNVFEHDSIPLRMPPKTTIGHAKLVQSAFGDDA